VAKRPTARRPLSRSAAVALACCGALAPAGAVRAESEAELLEIIQGLEQRVEQLETRAEDQESQAPAERRAFDGESADYDAEGGWADRVRIGGSANTGFYGGNSQAVVGQDAFQLWDARFFVDADLARDLRLGEAPLVRDVGFHFEWDLVRLGKLENRVGELYADFQGIGDQSWANVQVGRFQIPVGENYLRFAEGYSDNPFISNTVGGPWWWDEGLRANGKIGPLGYVTSVSDGDTPFNTDADSDKQFTLKLYTDPTPWLHVSLSGLRSGELGSSSSGANGALWLGEMWARMFGASSTLPNYVDGVAVPDGPNKLKDSWLAGGDVIVKLPDLVRVWLGGGWYGVDSTGASLYDRDLFYWIAEVVLEGAAAAPVLSPFYLGLRADGLGTYDSDRGYLLDSRQSGVFGWNMKSLEAYSLVLGWRIADGITMRAEYSFRDVGLVHGVSAEMKDDAQSQDVYGVEVGVDF
jgi:hypothetical protein